MMALQHKVAYSYEPLPEYTPARNVEIELEYPLPTLLAFDEKSGRYYQRIRCLIRLHTQPLGLVQLDFHGDELIPDHYAPIIWQSLQIQINDHLQQDGLLSVTTLTSRGLPALRTPLCIEERENFSRGAPFVSIIVATYNRPDQLAVCLRSLLALRYPHYELIVVDNAPVTSATADLVHTFARESPILRYVREDQHGLSWARNCGIAAAKGHILAFTDDDVVVDQYWLVHLARGFDLAEDVVCVSGLVLPLELETPAQFMFEEYGGFNKGFTFRIFAPPHQSRYPDMPLYPYVPGRFGAGASMAFKADFLRAVGGFDPALGSKGLSPNGQDIAMFLQVVLEGYKMVYQPAALLYHLHRRDYRKLCQQIYYYGVGSTAFLTRLLVNNPLCLFDFIMKVPYGLYFILHSRSPKNKKRSKAYPEELIALERKGMLFGPLAYIITRGRLNRLRKRSRSQ